MEQVEFSQIDLKTIRNEFTELEQKLGKLRGHL